MTRQQVLDLYFLDARHKLIDLAAFVDRVERSEGKADFRMEAFRQAAKVLAGNQPDKAAATLNVFSDPTTEPIEAATTKAACGAWPGGAGVVNNDKEFAITEKDGKFTVLRNGVAMTMSIEETGTDTAGYTKFRLEFEEPAELVRLGEWIGEAGATSAVNHKLTMFIWHLANRSEHRGKDPKNWLTKTDFGLKPKIKTKTLKNPKTKKPLNAREKIRYEVAIDMAMSESEALAFACQ